MTWWLIYNKATGAQVSETDTAPTGDLPTTLASVEVPARPNYETHKWDSAARAFNPIPTLPGAEIVVYTSDDTSPVEEANASQPVNFRVTIPGVGDERIVIPIDRLNAQNEVQESAAQWLALQFTSDVATGSVTFDKSGRYGVGPWTSQKRFNVPLKYVTVLA